jgi:ABC-2 type transport system permease protein
MLARTLTIIRKEFIHIIRDPRTLAVMFLIPIIQLILLGYAATTDVSHLATAVLDGDRSAQSRALIDGYQATNYFEITHYVSSEEEMAALIGEGAIRAGMIIPPGYAQDLLRNKTVQIAFVIDGSDPSVAASALAAAQSVGQAQSLKIAAASGLQPALGPTLPGLQVRPRVWYNPDLRSAYFMIPGLIGTILQFLTTMLTALAIVRERERGTIEQLIVTPVRAGELMVGKLIPYIGIGLFDSAAILAMGHFWFEVPIRGSLVLLFALLTLFLMTALGIGLFISTVSKTQQEAMLLTFMTLLPTIFLSGFFFPIEAMPNWLQAISYAVPLRYLLVILRGIVLKGVGLGALREQVIALLIFGPAILGLATTRFSKRLA